MVGGGYTGLWAALRAKERDPAVDVVLLEAGHCGDQASGRNGGFASASLTHGFGNGVARWPGEMDVLDRLGAENLRGIADTVRRHDIDCRWEETGELSVATAPHEADDLADLAEAMRSAGHDVRLLDETAVRAEVGSPTYVAGLWEPGSTALVEPARLAWGLRQAVLDCRRACLRGHRGHGARRARRGDARPHTRWRGPRGTGGARHQRLPVAAAPAAAHDGARLRLRADDRAALGRAEGLDRLGAPPGGGRRVEHVPLLPAHS